MNRLRFESSPYLLQHKDNPVDWFPWGKEALDKAIQLDKPILLSIGYSSCHWCHVMEHESFSDPQIAAFMNDHFINIKLDREERPDLDKVYMDAIVSLTGSGGWPLNCFLLPDKRPFYGGTYFPPSPAHQRPSWIQILQFIVKIYRERKEDVIEQAERLSESMHRGDKTLITLSYQHPIDPSQNIGEQIFNKLAARFDRSWGGFGIAPKFPSCMSLKYLLDYFFYSKEPQALDFADFTLKSMIRGGIFDHLHGGFARYATDKEWRIPHFEKMLYDNSQLISVLSHIYKLRPDPIFKYAVENTFHWLTTKMKSKQGGFYAALDADSEHVEGKYYVWTLNELKTVLSGPELDFLLSIFDLYEEGNWDDPHGPTHDPKNILWVKKELSDEENLLSNQWELIKQKLLSIRSRRVPPQTDTKVIISWNALLCIGLIDAFDAFGDQNYWKEAQSLLDVLDQTMNADHMLHQVDGDIPAMLDDLAYTITAYIHAYRSGGDYNYLRKAMILTEVSFTTFYDSKTKAFNYSCQKDLIAQGGDTYDNTMPSASGSMAYNLIQLGKISSQSAWEKLGNDMVSRLAGAIVQYPESLSNWSCLLLMQITGGMEIKLPNGSNMASLSNIFLPNPIISYQNENEEYILCHKFTCEMPCHSIHEFRLLLGKHYSIES